MLEAHVILVKGDYNRREEGVCDSAIYPGEIVELAADGKFDVVQATKAETVKGVAGCKIALEDRLQGRTVDDAYASTDRLFYIVALPGDEFQLLVKSGENIAVGDTLVPEAAGSGLFTEAAGTETSYGPTGFEALESSGGALAANTLVWARKL